MLSAARKIANVVRGRDFIKPSMLEVPTEFHGTEYGGWAIEAVSLRSDSVVYSVGIGEDVSFDMSVIAKYGCKIVAFDPTPRSLAWVKAQRLDARFSAFPMGLGGADGEIEFFEPENEAHVSYSAATQGRGKSVRCPIRRLSTLMAERGHSSLDLLKMDIEGAEYEVIDDVLRARIPIRQWLIEFHHRMLPSGGRKTARALRQLRAAGYEAIYMSPTGQEFSFLKRS